MTVTMAEIDHARENARITLQHLHSLPPGSKKREGDVALLAMERAEVERLLHAWWAQGCREPGTPVGSGGKE